MASALDSAINQHLLNLKANSSTSVRPPGAPAHFAPLGHGGVPGAMGLGMLPFGTMPAGTMGTMGAPPPFAALPTGGHPLPPGAPGQMLPLPLGAPGPVAGMPPAGGPTMVGVLSVAIDNLPFRYHLSEVDLRETFQRWGPLAAVQVSQDGAREVGVITFEDQIDASDAQRQLHGHVFVSDGAQGILSIVRGGPEQLSPPMGKPPAFQAGPVPGNTGPPPVGQPPAGGMAPPQMGGQVAGPPLVGQGPPGSLPGLSGAMPKGSPTLAPAGGPVGGWGAPTPANANGRPAWCCKVIIQNDMLHPDFPTVSKIVGTGMANIEHLRSQTNCQVLLRGRGSQHHELDGQELMEPMFLWLSSESPQNGKACLEMAQDLLTSVYEEHQAWCTQHGLVNQMNSTPLVIENPEVIPAAASAPAPSPMPALGQSPFTGPTPAMSTAPAMPLQGTAPMLGNYGPCRGFGGTAMAGISSPYGGKGGPLI